MKQLISLSEAENAILCQVRECIGMIRSLVSEDIRTIHQGIDTLRRLREAVYEDLNQIQHEEMILRAARWLQGSDLEVTAIDWYWNPRQTGTSAEPDLRGVAHGEVVISAEITTSARPRGKIDERMTSTLKKLSTMAGARYYFVLSPEMAKRARTKINKHGYDIQVREV